LSVAEQSKIVKSFAEGRWEVLPQLVVVAVQRREPVCGDDEVGSQLDDAM
jgi:predicted dinucleotide-binding enzyme